MHDLAWQGYRHEGTDQEKISFTRDEFTGLTNPLFFFYHEHPSATAEQLGYIALERFIHRYDRSLSDPLWQEMIEHYPALQHLLYEKGQLTMTLVSGIVVHPDHQDKGIGKALLTYAVERVIGESDVILGLTKNPAAIGLRRSVVSRMADPPLDMWVGRVPLLAQMQQAYPFFLQTLTAIYARHAGGYLLNDPALQDIVAMPTPYLPKPFEKENPAELNPLEREWIGRLYDAEAILPPDHVAVLPLIAVSRAFRQFYEDGMVF